MCLQFCCVYCLCRERWCPDGEDSFSVEHSRPQAAAQSESCDYDNLLFTCGTCSTMRQARGFSRPRISALSYPYRPAADAAGRTLRCGRFANWPRPAAATACGSASTLSGPRLAPSRRARYKGVWGGGDPARAAGMWPSRATWATKLEGHSAWTGYHICDLHQPGRLKAVRRAAEKELPENRGRHTPWAEPAHGVSGLRFSAARLKVRQRN